MTASRCKRIELKEHSIPPGPSSGDVRLHDSCVLDRTQADLSLDLQNKNAELRLSQVTLQESRDRYLDLYMFAPVGYLTLTSRSVISEINLTGVGMLMGLGQKKVFDCRFSNFIAPKDKGRCRRIIAQVKQDGDKRSCALVLRRRDGTNFHAQLDCAPQKTMGAMGVRVTVTDLTERKRMEVEIENLAFYDPLTHLPNRRLLLDRLQHATVGTIRTKLHGAILMIDLDDFKTLNDTQGHDAGDALLQQAARRLSACVRASDTVARLGGDEFVVMLDGLKKESSEAAAEAKIIGDKILAALNEPYFLGTEEYRSSSSIGITLFGSNQASVKELLKRADLALYTAKRAGGRDLRFFEPDMQAAAMVRAHLEFDLRRGVQLEQFELHYQPQVGRDGRLEGAEALLRWRHPEKGLLAPVEFISLAEEKGLIIALGDWVLRTACAQLSAWSRHEETAELTLSINISAHEFRRQDFALRVLETIDEFEVNPEKLILELTESSLLGNVENTVAKMNLLRARGLRFSLDDFGIGYSSLTYLKDLPLDQLKIDRSFITDLTANSKDAAIVGSILSLGNSLQLAVIAEGVETTSQQEYLLSHGCQKFQGFLFGRPIPMKDWKHFQKS